MCIAILNQPNSFIPKHQLKNAWDNNNHGAGIAYIDKGVVCSYHEPDSFDSFYEEYEYIRTLSDLPIMLHFRIATHGKGKDMLHPHDVTPGRVSLVHNGIISGLGDNKISDTREYAEMLGKFYPDTVSFLDHPGIYAFAVHALGNSNKVIFLDWQGDYEILNDHLGHYDADGNWFSNNSYKQLNNYVWAGNKKVWRGGGAWKAQTQPTIAPIAKPQTQKSLWEEEIEADEAALAAWEKDSEFQIKNDISTWDDDNYPF